jgi:gliding motility-associated-like protein
MAGELFSLPIFVTDETSTQVTLTASGAPYMVSTFPPVQLNVSGVPPLITSFEWQTVCAHVKKDPYQLFLKATDNGPQVALSSFKTVNINVIAPAPQNLTSYPIKNSILLEWDTYSCKNAKEIHIYKKSDSSDFEPDFCQTGIPPSTGFRLLAKVDTSHTSYSDNGTITPVAHGREYCYRIIAVFSDGAESMVSNETCAAIANDAPMITHVDIEQTSEDEGMIFVSWLPPPEIDTLSFPGPNYEYRIFRSTSRLYDFIYIATTVSLQDTSFIDNKLNTKEIQYFYKVEFWGENLQGIVEYIDTSDPASSIFLMIEETDKRLNLTWNEHVPWKNETYIIFRFNDQTQLFDSIASTTENSYVDLGLLNGITYCYFVTSSGRYSMPEPLEFFYNRSQVKCAIPYDNIPPDTPTTEITTDCENVTFWWTFPHPDSYLDAYQYYIYYQPNYQTPLVCIDSFSNSSLPCYPLPCSHVIQNLTSVTGCYAMLIKDEAGNMSEMTSKLCFDVDACKTYSLPNVFTPDGDGVNDTWVPFPYTNVQKIDLVVHDRWGKRVFKTEDPDIEWDGKDEQTQRPLPEGTYYYGCDVYLYTLNGIKKKFISGVVLILRGSGGKQNY